MTRSISFAIEAFPSIIITVVEEPDGRIRFDIENTLGLPLDLRALYFDLNDEFSELSDEITVQGDDVVLTNIGDNDVTKVGSGTTINGEVVNEYGAFDVGVGLDADSSEDPSTTTFYLSHESADLNLDMISLADFGIRMDGGEPKAGDISTMALLAVDDDVEVDENAIVDDVNLLGNDRQSEGLFVTAAILGSTLLTLDDWNEVTTDGGRTGALWVGSDGTLKFDASTGFDNLNVDATDSLTIDYASADNFGSTDSAAANIVVTGLNDRPVKVEGFARTISEDDALLSLDLLEGAEDIDIGAVLSVVDIAEINGLEGWSIDGNSISIDPNHFNSLNREMSVDLNFGYTVTDEWGATVDTMLTVTVDGRNDGPTVEAPLALTVSEEDPVFSVDLLTGADDVDIGAMLNAVNIFETAGQGGWMVDGNSIVIDPNYFDDLNDGDIGTLEFQYQVKDEWGAQAHQTLTVDVEGFTDAPFIDVQLNGGETANIAFLTVTTEQARDEKVSLAFHGLPAGAVLLDAQEADASAGVEDALGVTTYSLEFPLGTDLHEFKVTVIGTDPDGTEIGKRDAIVELGYEGVTTTNALSFEAVGQNIWGSGDAFTYSISEYTPLLGGQRETFTLLDVSSSDNGLIKIFNDEVEWIPSAALLDELETEGIGASRTVSFNYSYVNDKNPNEVIVETVDVTAARGNFITTFSGDNVSTRDQTVVIDVLADLDVLTDPLSTGELTLINIDVDTDEIFSSITDPLKAARDGLDALLSQEEQKLMQAEADRDAIAEEAALLTVLVAQQAEVVARQIVFATANAAFNAAENAVEFFQDALDAAKSVLSSAQSKLNSAKSKTARLKDAYEDSIKTVFGVKVGDPIKLAAWKAAELAQATAQGALNLAKKAVDLAQDAFDSAAVDASLSFLETQKNNAQTALNEAEDDVDATEQLLEDGGYFVDASQAGADDLLLAAAELTAAQAEVTVSQALILGYEAGRAIAQGAVDFAQGVIDTVDFQAKLKASVEAYAQAGFQFDFSISGGTVDSKVDYEITTVSGYNQATDVLTIEAVLENQTTGNQAAFTTVSPNVQIYAGILYDLGANFEFLVDFYAAIESLVLADLSPNSDGIVYDPTPNIEGSLDFIDFDSREGAEIEFGVSGTSDLDPEFLEFSLAAPNIETIGVEEAPSIDYYQEGELLNLDFGELLGSVKNLLEARIDLSPEMKALLNDAGVDPADPANDQFFEAFLQALGIAISSATGEGDTDGDGTVPFFLLDATDETSGALLHINSIPDDLTGIDPETLGQFGFYAAYGESDRIFEVTLDVDQLVAILANRASGNPSPIVFNPLDIEFGVEDALQIAKVNEETAAEIANFIDLNLNAEFADFDVSTGVNFSQEFTLSLDEFDYVFTMEDGTEYTRSATDPALTLENASQHDANLDGVIDYALQITPNAQFSNDTELGLGFSYMLDLVKTSFSAGINIPLEKIFGDEIDILGLGADNIEFSLFDSAIGPLFRVQGDIDAVTLDIFEDRFAIDMGMQSVNLSSSELELV